MESVKEYVPAYKSVGNIHLVLSGTPGNPQLKFTASGSLQYLRSCKRGSLSALVSCHFSQETSMSKMLMSNNVKRFNVFMPEKSVCTSKRT